MSGRTFSIVKYTRCFGPFCASSSGLKCRRVMLAISSPRCSRSFWAAHSRSSARSRTDVLPQVLRAFCAVASACLAGLGKPRRFIGALPIGQAGARPGERDWSGFLNHIRKNKVPVTIFLVNGVKLQGVVTWFDNFCVLLRRDGQSQLVYKHAISTVMPSQPITLYEAEAE